MTNKFKSVFAPAKNKLATGTVTFTLAALALTGCSAANTASSGQSTTSVVSTSASSATATGSSSATAATSAASSSSADATSTKETITNTTAAAQKFLATLSTEQQDTVTYDYNDEEKSVEWSNFPVTFVQRSGINLKDLSAEQKAAALEVLKNLLNDESYKQVENIMAGDQFLKDNSTSTEDSLGQYYIAFFGNPSDTSAWSIQFGGHHLGLNADLNGASNSITFAPTHLGSQPYSFTSSSGETITTMDGIYNDAFAFYNSLTDEQRTRLYQGDSVPNLSCAPGSTCDFPTGTGIAGSELSDAQKEALLTLIKHWAGMADEQTWEAQKSKILASIDQTYISWSGATKYDTSIDGGIYFLISGPNVYLEFSGQAGSAGADVNGAITSGWGHVHSIYRDPSNDYAGSVTQQASSGPGGGPGGGAGAPPAGMGTPPSGAMGTPPTGAPSN